MARIANILLGKAVTLVLAALAFAVGLATFVFLARGAPFGLRPGVGVGLVLANLSAVLLLVAVLAGRLTRVWVERRRGSAGARLHVRLVLLFGGVAVAPAILVACFAVAFFHFGIQAWFNDPVREAVTESLQVSHGYLDEHRDNIRAVALEMANDLTRAGQFLTADPSVFVEVLGTQTTLRGLTEAVIYDPLTRQVLAAAGLFAGMGIELPSQSVTIAGAGRRRRGAGRRRRHARAGGGAARFDAAADADDRPAGGPGRFSITSPAPSRRSPNISGSIRTAPGCRSPSPGSSRSWRCWCCWPRWLIGLVLANQIARPIGRLILAAERVRSGDLGVRVTEAPTGDELAGLSRAFNRMTGQLAAQRGELMDAYSQIDERRRFTETVLSGVSAGVIGLDASGRIELPNRAADELLGLDLMAAIGRELADVVPEFADLLHEAAASPERARTAEIQIGPPTRRRTLLVRIGADLSGGRTDGFVVTFDDITELQSAQRKAAWADVARRIAHEIKNPLTPIQLAAERLKRRFTREITSDPDTFSQCADTIIRHVGDIGRMVDEFSSFRAHAAAGDQARGCRPHRARGAGAAADRAAADHLAERDSRAGAGGAVRPPAVEPGADQSPAERRRCGGDARMSAGTIGLRVELGEDDVRIIVTDDGIGLPQEDRARLTEPYVTHKPKGTGLGLAIVKKIMEDHGGRLTLDDRPDGPGAVAVLVLPAKVSDGV